MQRTVIQLAPDELAYTRCDAVGNPEALELAQREPLGFANLVGELRGSTRGAASVRLSAGDATTTLVPYPDVSAESHRRRVESCRQFQQSC